MPDLLVRSLLHSCSPPTLLHPAQLRLLLDLDLRLDPLFRPPFPHPHHSIRSTHRVQTFCSFHRFFSQARWNLDDLGHCVFQLLLPFCAEVLVGAVDDTLARKSGAHLGRWHAPRSPALHPEAPFLRLRPQLRGLLFAVALPFAPDKYCAFPILVRMYRKRQTNQRAPGKGGKLERKQTGQATAMQYRTRPELALEMIQMVASWIPDRLLRILGIASMPANPSAVTCPPTPS